MEYGDYFDESSTEEGQFETAKILGEEFSLPKELAESEDVFNEFFSLQSYDLLTPSEQENLKKFLPTFPENDAEEKEETLKRLLNREVFNFSSPLSVFQQHLHNGFFRPDIAHLRAIMKKAERRHYKEEQKNYKYKLLKDIIVERKDVLDTVYNSPPGPIKFPRHYVSNNPAGDPLRQKVRKRYFQELAAVRSEVGEYSQSSEDEIYQDRAPRMLSKKQRQKLNILEASLADSDMIIVTSTLATKPNGFDLETHVTNTNNPYEINDEAFKKMLANHRKRRVAMDRHPTLDTYGIKIEDIALRTGTPHLGQKRTSARAGSVATYAMNDKSARRRLKSSKSAEIRTEVNDKKINRDVEEVDSYRMSDESSDEELGEISQAFDRSETEKSIDVENSSPTNIPQNQKLIEREQNKGAEKSSFNDPSMVIDVMNLPVDVKDDDFSFGTTSDLMQATHNCYFSLLRDIICSSPQHRMTVERMEQKLKLWESNPISPLNEWFSIIDHPWSSMLQSALNFLSGDFTAEYLPEDYVPYMEYKPNIRSYQWIGAGRDSDTHLRALCSYWLEHHNHINLSALPPPMKCQLKPNDDPELLEDIEVDDADDDVIDFDAHTDDDVPPPRCPTTWKVRPSTEEEKLKFQEQEKERFMNPTKAFTYKMHDYESVVGPVKGIYNSQTTGSSVKPRGHNLLSTNRPSYVTVLALVRDAAARLPNGEGTRADICTLIRDSQYLDLSGAQDNTLQSVVSGALDRLHCEVDACIRFDTKRKLWVYLHRRRSEHEMELMHQQMQNKPKVSKKNNRKKTAKDPTQAINAKELESSMDKKKKKQASNTKVLKAEVNESKEDKVEAENAKGKAIKQLSEPISQLEPRSQEIITSAGKKLLLQASQPTVKSSGKAATQPLGMQQKVVHVRQPASTNRSQQSTLLKHPVTTVTTQPVLSASSKQGNATTTASQFLTSGPIQLKGLAPGTFFTQSGQKVQIISSSAQNLGQIQSIQLSNGQNLIAHDPNNPNNASNLITNLQNLQQVQIITSSGQLIARALNTTSANTIAVSRATDTNRTVVTTKPITSTSILSTAPNVRSNTLAVNLPIGNQGVKNSKGVKVVTTHVANAIAVDSKTTAVSLLSTGTLKPPTPDNKDDAVKCKITGLQMIQKPNTGKLAGVQLINASNVQLVNAPLSGKSPASILTGVKLVSTQQGVKMVPTSSTIVQSAVHGPKVTSATISTNKTVQSPSSVQLSTASNVVKQQSSVVTSNNIANKNVSRSNTQIFNVETLMQGIRAAGKGNPSLIQLPHSSGGVPQFAVVSQANISGHPKIIQTQQLSNVSVSGVPSQTSTTVTTAGSNTTKPALTSVRVPTNLNLAAMKPVIVAKSQSQSQNVIMTSASQSGQTLVLSAAQSNVSANTARTTAPTGNAATVQCLMQPGGTTQQLLLPASAINLKTLQGLKVIPLSSATGQKVYARFINKTNAAPDQKAGDDGGK